MKERPILFSAPMVRAVLDGSKTQTRRIIKDQLIGEHFCEMRPEGAYLEWLGTPCCGSGVWDVPEHSGIAKVPYGVPGDRLWVREAFDFLPAGGPDEPQACVIVYWATGSTEPRSAPESYNPMIYGREKVRPSIHMPRWASRITLEVTAVRVETLGIISHEDALAEGVSSIEEYKALWININGAWLPETWVWVVDFRMVLN